MPEKMFTYTVPEDADTCKSCFTFKLNNDSGKVVIDNLEIVGSKGCGGHPRTISALVRGRALEELPEEALAGAACGRAMSCGQTLVAAMAAYREGVN